MGAMILCVKDEQVFKISVTQLYKNGTIVMPKLSGQTVLQMLMFYQNQNRIPFHLEYIQFSRISFDNDGVFDLGKEVLSEEFRASFQYVMRDLHQVSGYNLDPLPLPKSTSNPTATELNALKAYLNQKYPELLKKSPYMIHQAILREEQIYKSQIELMKESYR